ncbi:MAG TPA: flagellar hook-associated protein FlgK [Solirubrobacteraceae bacterium]|nr:flagellar hook-associated protein FlgK [Solirubrobacteraceae bacterium]
MAISSFYGLQTSLRGLLAQQRSLDVTGHNVANASTKGYTRQEAVLAASDALQVPAGAVQNGSGAHIGSGVDVQAYRRVRDGFLDLQYRAQATRLGEERGIAEGLGRAELALAEPSDDGLSSRLSDFWDAWSGLANAPEDSAARQAVIEQGQSLAGAFKTVDDQLALVRSQAAEEYATLTASGGRIEQIAGEIGQLNDTIKRFVTAGDPPNDLMDRRDVLLDELSTLAQVSVEDLGTGSLRVTFGGPGDPPLVDDTTVNFPPALSAPSGRLGALRDLAAEPGGRIAQLRSDLNGVAETLAGAVNRLHPGFFSFTPGAAAATLSVATDAAGLNASYTGFKGANDVALQIGQLRGGAADDLYGAFVARVGSEVSQAARQEANAQALTDSVDDRRQSVAGVSLDEEMTNLIRFQRAYQASSRAMSTMDEMLDVLINRTGRVGL